MRIIPPPPAPSPLPHIKSNARIRINSINFKSGSYPKYSVDFKVKDATFKADDRVRISKYIQSRRTIFLKDMLLIGKCVIERDISLLILMVKKMLEFLIKLNCTRLIN